MKKWILRIVLGVIALLIIVVVLTFVMINQVAKTGIEKGGTYALGVPTTVNTVNLSLFGGTFGMNELQVGNPPGYKGAHLMKSGKFDLKVDSGTVLSDTVVINSFQLHGLDVIIEKDLKTSNVQVVMDHLKQLGGQPAAQPVPGQPAPGEPAPQQPAQPPAEKKPGKKVKVDDIVIRNVTAKFYIMGGPPISVPVPEVHLTNVSSGGEGVTVPQLMAKIFTAIMAAVAQQAEKAGVPLDMVNNLKDSVASTAASLGGNTSALVGEASKSVTEALGPGAGQAATQAQETITKGLGGLLGKPQTQPAQPK